MAAFQEDLASFERLDTQVLGVSSDDLETHRRFAASLDLGFPLLTDPGGKLAAQYGRGRIAFLIDKGGVVRHVAKGMPDNADLLRRIESLGSGGTR
jgi:peroxiredoxin Q/BCP